MCRNLITVLFCGFSLGLVSAQEAPSSADIIMENTISHSKNVPYHHMDNVVIIPGGNEKSSSEFPNPFRNDDYFKITEDVGDKTLNYRTKNLNLKVAEDGVTINGDFHQWRRKNSSWGIFDRAREAQIRVTAQSKVVLYAL